MMSSSSSDSDSDEFEPIRRIKINIRPKEDPVRRGAADVNEIKASVEAWRPLGPPPHPSLSRRQSSLSSVSSMSFGPGSAYGSVGGGANTSASTTQGNYGNHFGVTIRSSPSCSSLVNEFNNRSSFSNFMSTTSRTSSPLTLVNHGDAVPIAIAIQESIELIVKGHYDPSASEPKFHSRCLGNIKVAFPNAFARGNYGKPGTALKLCMHSTENMIRYYASRLIKDLDLGTNGVDEVTDAFSHINEQNNSNSINGNTREQQNDLSLLDLFDTKSVSSTKGAQQSSKIIEFDVDVLMSQLKKMYDQSPTSRYYNVDVLRYLITPITSIEECPLQVCAYWKVEAELVKLRIDFKHSSKCGLNLERLREITFAVNFADFIPPGVEIKSMSPDSQTNSKLNNNNNNSGAMNMNNFQSTTSSELMQSSTRRPLSLIDNDGVYIQRSRSPGIQVRIPPPPPQQSLSRGDSFSNKSVQFDAFGTPLEPLHRFPGKGNNLIGLTQMIERSSNMYSQQEGSFNNPMPPYITHEPQAHWNNSIKQLTWKFDTLLSYYKTDGLGSLFAKLDFRNYHGMPSQFLNNCKPTPVDVKFLVIDSTLSKISMSIDAIGYKMSLLKKEIRSGRYKSEPYIL